MRALRSQMLFTNYPYVGEPSQLLGGDVSSLTLSQLQNINGSLSLTVNGIDLHGQRQSVRRSEFLRRGGRDCECVQFELADQRPTTSGDTITPVSVSFTGTINGGYLEVTSVSKGGSIELGSMISGTGVPTGGGAQIVTQLNGTPGGVGLYALLGGQEVVSSEAMTESYGVLTVGTVLSGQITVGEQVHGAGIAPLTAIEASDSWRSDREAMDRRHRADCLGRNRAHARCATGGSVPNGRWRDREPWLFRHLGQRFVRLR